jgi:alpha-beta hydrolase superfamily lysophospholipase
VGLGLGLVEGCARGVERGEGPTARFSAPRLESDAFVSFDGERLPMRVWTPETGVGQSEAFTVSPPETVIVALHGFDDYSRSFAHAGPVWARQGITTYAYDQRGFGQAPGRGLWGGARPMVEDLRVLCSLVRERHPKALIAVAGESMGGAVAICAFASDRPPRADRLVLLSPAVWGWRTQPLANKVGLWLIDRVAPAAALEPPAFIADQYRCSDNDAVLKQMDKDPLIINATRADATYGLIDLMQQASDQIGRVKAPTLYLYGAHDTMIPRAAAFQAAAALGPNGRTAFYPDGWHLLNRDLHADRVLGDVASFVRRPDAPLPSAPPKIPAPQAAA